MNDTRQTRLRRFVFICINRAATALSHNGSTRPRDPGQAAAEESGSNMNVKPQLDAAAARIELLPIAEGHPSVDAQDAVRQLFPGVSRSLEESFDDLIAGHGRCVLVRGDADAGLPLIAEMVRGRSTPARHGRATAARRVVSMWPVHEAFPELSGPLSEHAPTAQLMTMVLSLLRQQATFEPVVVLFEDVEEADHASLAAIDLIADLASELPILCVVTASSCGFDPIDDFLDGLTANGRARTLSIGAASDASLATYLAHVAGAPLSEDVLQYLLDRSGGLTVLAERILRRALADSRLTRTGWGWECAGDLDQALPAEVGDIVTRSLLQTTARQRDVLCALALLGSVEDIAVATAVTDLEADAITEAALGLARARLVRLTPVLGLRTGVIRELVVRNLLPRARERLLIKAIEAMNDASALSTLEAAFGALERSGQHEVVARQRIEAALRATSAGEFAVALKHLEWCDRNERRLDAEAQRRADWVRSELLARRGGRRADAEPVIARLTAAVPGEAERAQVNLARTVALTSASAGRPLADGGVLGTCGAGRLLLALEAPLAARARALEALHDKSVQAERLRHLAALTLPTDDVLAAGMLHDAVAAAVDVGDEVERRRAVAAAAQVEHLQGSPASRWVTAVRGLQDRGDVVVGGRFAVDLGLSLLWAGNSDGAVAVLKRARETAGDISPSICSHAAAARAAAAILAGMDASVTDALLAGVDRTSGEPAAKAARALAAAVAADFDEAHALIGELPIVADPGVVGVPTTQWAWLLAMRDLLGRRVPERSEVAAASPWQWTATTRAWSTLAEAARFGATRRTTEAVAAAVDADRRLAEMPNQQMLARQLIGARAAADGWFSRPIELMVRGALARAMQQSLSGLARACRSTLRSGGAAVPRARGSVAVPIDLRVAGVTEREMEVIRLLAAGKSTDEVAAHLFVSVATVKSHAAHAMKKLGYESRRELLEALADFHT